MQTRAGRVTVSKPGQAIEEDGKVVQRHIGSLTSVEDDGFLGAHTAFIGDGALVHVPAGARVERPVHLAFVSTDEENFVSHPRVLVVAGPESEATVIESYVGLGDNTYLNNGWPRSS